MAEHKKVITDIIELYRDFTCLWDFSLDSYRDSRQKTEAWEIMANKYKEIEPEANVTSVKKKIENLKTSYKREARKVRNSIRAGSASREVHKPNLWYYELMTFLDKQNRSNEGIDVLTSNDELQESEQSYQCQRKKPRLSGRKKHKLIDTAQKLLEQKSNSFGLYVGEQLDLISTSTHQRQIAEKLISEVIFLAKTDKLNSDSRIDTPPCCKCLNYNKISQPSPSFSSLNYK